LFLFDEVKKSHYEVLGVASTAAEAEIKRAYFNMVRKYQPDRFPEEFKEIRAAYETLMDGQKRAEYDAIGDLPPSVAPLFHEAQRLDHVGKRRNAAELYQLILKSHPDLDNVRKEYALSLSADDKTGKAAEVWEELCRRHPDNPQYVRKLSQCYFDRGWHKKALTEARRALTLDRSSLDSWSLLVSCAVENLKSSSASWDELCVIANEALDAVREVKTDEWKKIYIHTYAFLTAGIDKPGKAKKYLREIIRLIREGGRAGGNEGRQALGEILAFIPAASLAALYPELKEMAALLPDLPGLIRGKLDAVRLSFEIESLVEKKFHEIFRDLFRILNADVEEEDDELEVTSIEFHLLDDKKTFDPQIRRLREEFPELYALHASFFNAALRTRDPEKMLYQRSKKIRKLKRLAGFDEEEPDSGQTETVRRSQPKVGRNDPCPCGSGKKYKHCCGA
jgi:tetratricopeptide (TPR) repeat protein